MVSVSSLNTGPDILLIILVYFAANCNRSNTILVSFLIGFAADVSSVAMLIGPYTISYGLLGGLISLFRRQVIRKRMLYQSMAIFSIGTIAGSLAELLIFAKSGEIAPNIGSVILLTSLYSAVIGPFIWKFSASRTRLSLWKKRVSF
jgi:rod shape-determining protein MreD